MAKQQPFFILLLGSLAGLSLLAIDMYLPSMPSIAQELASSSSAVQLTVSVFLFFFAVTQLLFGPLSDAMGRRPIILWGLLFYIGGSLLAALATTINILLSARALQGIGAAAISVTVPALVRDRFSGPDFTSTMGFIMMIMTVVPILAPLLGGLVYTVGGWRSVFTAMAVIAIVATLLFQFSGGDNVPVTKRRPLEFRQYLGSYKVLLGDRQCLFLSLCASLIFAGLMAFITASPFVYIDHYGITPQLYAVLFVVNTLGILALTWLSNRLVYRSSSLTLLKAGVGLVLIASLVLLVLSFAEQPPLYLVVLACALFIANIGILTSNVMGLLMARFSHIAGSTSAVVGSLRYGVGAAAGALVSVWHTDDSTALTAIMAACGFLVVISFALARPQLARQTAV